MTHITQLWSKQLYKEALKNSYFTKFINGNNTNKDLNYLDRWYMDQKLEGILELFEINGTLNNTGWRNKYYGNNNVFNNVGMRQSKKITTT